MLYFVSQTDGSIDAVFLSRPGGSESGTKARDLLWRRPFQCRQGALITGKPWENHGENHEASISTLWVTEIGAPPDVDFVHLCGYLYRVHIRICNGKETVKIPNIAKMRSTMSTVHDVHSTVEGRYNRMDMQWDAEPMHNICDQQLEKLKSYLYSVPGDSHARHRERERESVPGHHKGLSRTFLLPCGTSVLTLQRLRL